MKKFMALLLTFTLCLSLCGITAAALKEELDISAKETYSGTCGENLTWTYSTESQELSISGTGEMVNYGSEGMAPWNDYRDSIKSVVISDGVTSIGRCAFYLCSSLSSVTLPDSIMSICGQAFQGCRTLMSITIPAKVTTIENDAFIYCYRLVEVINHSSLDLSNTQQFGLTYIARYSLEVHSGESKLSVVNDYVFYPLTNDKIYLVHYSGDATSLVLPSNYNGERYAIHEYAFCYMSNLESVSIPNGIDFLASYSFIYCSSLKSVVIPDSVTHIENHAFNYCTSLESITIPDSVTSIGFYAFDNCPALKTVYYCGTEAQWNAINIGDSNNALTSANRVYIPHFNFAEGADTEDVTVGTSSRQTYFKAGGMTVAEIKALYAEGDIIITKANGTVLTDNSLVGTGCVIASTLQGTTKHHKVVVLGDINGDGKVNATDYSQVLNHAKGKVQLSGVKLTAANVSAATSATINAADYGQVLGFATGKTLKFNTVVE